MTDVQWEADVMSSLVSLRDAAELTGVDYCTWPLEAVKELISTKPSSAQTVWDVQAMSFLVTQRDQAETTGMDECTCPLEAVKELISTKPKP